MRLRNRDRDSRRPITVHHSPLTQFKPDRPTIHHPWVSSGPGLRAMGDPEDDEEEEEEEKEKDEEGEEEQNDGEEVEVPWKVAESGDR